MDLLEIPEGLNASVLALALVLLLIAVRQAGKNRLAIWQIMLGGAIFVLLCGEITPEQALQAIDSDVMIFLASMFVIGEAMQKSGYLMRLFSFIFKRATDPDRLVLLILFSMGLLSSILMNDTLAIIGTPLMLYLARSLGLSPKLLLLTLAFAVTIGSAMSPIGNPQNLLIAVNSDLKNPFWVFLDHLMLPSLANLMIAHLLLRLFYRSQFEKRKIEIRDAEITDPELAGLSRIALILLVTLIIAKIASVALGLFDGLRLSYIAIISALPILLWSGRRGEVVRSMDWCTLIFFASMFVLMDSVWRSGLFQSLLAGSNADMASIPTILASSVIMSQFISNVPLVALCQPLLLHPTEEALMALAAGSTIAGNLFILGAASNVIIIQNAERMGETITFFEFARVGVPLTLMNVLVYWAAL